MELHTNIYWNHPDPAIHKAIRDMFAVADVNSPECVWTKNEKDAAFIRKARALDAEAGEMVATNLVDRLNTQFASDLGSETITEIDGFYRMHMIGDADGDEVAGLLVELLYDLAPGIHAQAWGFADEGNWEFCFKMEDGEIVRKDAEPDPDDGKDSPIYQNFYLWWHAGMPDSVREGVLNEDDDFY